MKKILYPFFCLIYLTITATGLAQDRRYLDPVFEEVLVSDEIVMAHNYSILPWLINPGSGHTFKQSLTGQFYTPAGDTETERPLIIYLHTGNFFPYPANGSCSGTIRDSSIVEIATRLAKMGYVVVAVNYRQGWNPFDPNKLIRRFFLINAIYRGVQDVNTYVRYFRRSVTEFGNPHGINPERITVWGQGTGGYLSFAASYLRRYDQLLTTSDPLKFILPTPLGDVPMVMEQYNGTIDASGPVTIVDTTYHIIAQLPPGDTLCIPNHMGYSSDFALCVNLGGALSDSTWIEAGNIPLISFHVPSDVFAPCETDVLSVPPPPLPVMETIGSCGTARIAERLGINDIFKSIRPEDDPYGQFNTSGYPAFYSFNNTPDYSSAPWEWAAADNPPSICNQNAQQAKMYIDTIIGYFAPRAYIALNLASLSTKEHFLPEVTINIMPNPTNHATVVSTQSEQPIREITIIDVSGRVVDSYRNVDNQMFTIYRKDKAPGVYFVHCRLDNGVVTRRLIFN